MFSLRRYAVYLGLAACVLFSVFYFRTTALPRRSGIFGQHSHGDDSTAWEWITPDRDFRWDEVTPRYPVKSLTPLPTEKPHQLPKVQHEFEKEDPEHAKVHKQRQSAVKEAFQRCWKAYSDRALMSDEVSPITGTASNNFGGWAATLVDSLDTLWIMGLKSEFRRAVDAAVEIDLRRCTLDQVNVFETTIRHLGGFLSAYDLSGDSRLLEKAQEFGDMLIVAFDTPNRMPITRWYPRSAIPGPQEADHNVLVAEIGSLMMEFTRLSILTDDPKWYDAVERIVKVFDEQQDKTFLPGMWPVTINAFEKDFTKDSLFTLSAMSDSLYEYLPKMHALLGGVDPRYQKMYEQAMETAITNNLFRPMTPDNSDILISGSVRRMDVTSKIHLDTQGQHLVCFAGGMFALGGKLFDKPTHVDIGKKITKGCIWTYKAFPLGIMPELFRMVPCPSKFHCSWNETRWKEAILEEHRDAGEPDEQIAAKRLPKGIIDIPDTRYILRPEAIESIFLLYRMTGERYLQEYAWEMFNNVMEATKTPLANAALRDVTYTREQAEGKQIQQDSMESFWMAETLKYFYLIFSEPNLINLDDWVFNTEAHPFKRRVPAPA